MVYSTDTSIFNNPPTESLIFIDCDTLSPSSPTELNLIGPCHHSYSRKQQSETNGDRFMRVEDLWAVWSSFQL